MCGIEVQILLGMHGIEVRIYWAYGGLRTTSFGNMWINEELTKNRVHLNYVFHHLHLLN